MFTAHRTLGAMSANRDQPQKCIQVESGESTHMTAEAQITLGEHRLNHEG